MRTVREHLFKEIESTYAAVEQWKQEFDWAENVSRYYVKLEALVELGEIVLCGSTGGFDRKGGQNGFNQNFTLAERANHLLVNKHRIL